MDFIATAATVWAAALVAPVILILSCDAWRNGRRASSAAMSVAAALSVYGIVGRSLATVAVSAALVVVASRGLLWGRRALPERPAMLSPMTSVELSLALNGLVEGGMMDLATAVGVYIDHTGADSGEAVNALAAARAGR